MNGLLYSDWGVFKLTKPKAQVRGHYAALDKDHGHLLLMQIPMPSLKESVERQRKQTGSFDFVYI